MSIDIVGSWKMGPQMSEWNRTQWDDLRPGHEEKCQRIFLNLGQGGEEVHDFQACSQGYMRNREVLTPISFSPTLFPFLAVGYHWMWAAFTNGDTVQSPRNGYDHLIALVAFFSAVLSLMELYYCRLRFIPQGSFTKSELTQISQEEFISVLSPSGSPIIPCLFQWALIPIPL